MLMRNENICPQKNFTQMFIAALFIIAKSWKQSKFYHMANGYIKCGISIQQNIIQQQKGMKY